MFIYRTILTPIKRSSVRSDMFEGCLTFRS